MTTGHLALPCPTVQHKIPGGSYDPWGPLFQHSNTQREGHRCLFRGPSLLTKQLHV